MKSSQQVLTAIGYLAVLIPNAVLAETKPFAGPVRGLNPKVVSRYDPSRDFTCLDGSLTIPFSAVNDDYCDCPDGSDEPGTSACPTARFYCANKGHLPATILSSRVNDGICDLECCDGSDEWESGLCPDRCEEIGKEYRDKKEAEMKTRKTGSKIRGTYIKWAVAEKRRLEDELASKTSQVKDKEVEVEAARLNLEKMESKSKEELERRKQSPLYLSLLTHRLALTRLRSKTAKLENELQALRGILDDLAKGYNPNYQDMAVKAAVVGWHELSGTGSHNGEAEATEVKEEAAEGATTTTATEEEKEEEITDQELDQLERKDLESLLLSDSSSDDDDQDEGSGVLYKIDEYIPDILYDSYESMRDLAIEWLIRVGIIGKGAKPITRSSGVDAPHVQAAKEQYQALSSELGRLNADIETASKTIERMNDGYGPSGEWKKLEGTCIEKISGDYTYELCFFGRATQKSNKDGSSNLLGTYTSWNEGAAEHGSLAYYSTQYYVNGAKCWNGPMRSATVEMTCGVANALLAIYEPEKCEYHFKVTTPALCWPIEEQEREQFDKSQSIKQEL